MARDMGRGIIAPDNNDNIGTGASEMRTVAATAAAAINEVDQELSQDIDTRIERTEAYQHLLPRVEAAQYGIEGPPGPRGAGDPGPPGPGGSIALEETDPGCFVDSEITWVQWNTQGTQASVWNPVHERYERLQPPPRLVSTGVYEIGVA